MQKTNFEEVEQILLERREIDPATGCWLWTGSVDGHGYGALKVKGQQCIVSRLSAMIFLGITLNSKTCVLHRCDTPRCFNPDHLFIGSKGDNNRDTVAKKRGMIGSLNGRAKLTESDVQKIRQLLDTGYSLSSIGQQFNITKSTVSSIKRGVIWKQG